MDTNCNKAGGIDWGYMSITRAEGIKHGCVYSVEQQALLGRQSATAKVGNVSEVPRRKRQRTWKKEENRKLWECYL